MDLATFVIFVFFISYYLHKIHFFVILQLIIPNHSKIIIDIFNFTPYIRYIYRFHIISFLEEEWQYILN